MIFKELIVENFGLYRDEHRFFLLPDKDLNKNLIVCVGQNGVGKTTISEAIQLCILGPLVLGERSSLPNYEMYLSRRCHVKNEKGHNKERSRVELSLEYSISGKSIDYRIIRQWSNIDKTCNEYISIFENGEELNNLTLKEKNIFIRELIPPGYAKVIFFNGEQLQNLNENNSLNVFISECCQALFGLNIIYTLQRDIDHYINKLLSDKRDSHNLDEFNSLENEIASLVSQKETILMHEVDINNEKKGKLTRAIELENELSEKGRWVSEKIRDLDSQRINLENEISNCKRGLVEIFNELGPFTVSLRLCLKLEERLKKEGKQEKWRNAEEVIKEKLDELTIKFVEESYWESLNIKGSASNRRKLFKDFKLSLFPSNGGSSYNNPIIHELSESDRNKLLNWIDHIVVRLPDRIVNLTNDLNKFESDLQALIKERSTYSSEDVIGQLLKEHKKIHQEIGALENELKNLDRKRDDIIRRTNFFIIRRDSAFKKIVNQEDIDRKLKLSDKTRIVLKEYAEEILEIKLAKLQEILLEKFNKLCRKTDYFDKVYINRTSFNITLYQGEKEIDQEFLSAGEKQILAFSILWSLHSISNITLPVIIDTPLARLDETHRESVLKELLPSISSQVIILGTDSEFDKKNFNEISERINHCYTLKFDPKLNITHVSHCEEKDLIEVVVA